jgi:hypothetical protein
MGVLMKNLTKKICYPILALILSACGGGGGGSSSPVVNQSIGGIWRSQYTVPSGVNAGDLINGVAIVNESGQFYTYAHNTVNGCSSVAFGQLSVNGTSVTGNEDAAIVTYGNIPGVNLTCRFSDGSTTGTGTITGTFVQRTSASLTSSGITSQGTILPAATVPWTFNTLYLESPSYTKIAGNYSDGGSTLTISSSGNLSETNATTGCVLSGNVSIPNASYNAYTISFTYSGCTGSYAGANGVTVSGLATLDDTVVPNVLYAGLSARASGNLVIAVFASPKQ